MPRESILRTQLKMFNSKQTILTSLPNTVTLENLNKQTTLSYLLFINKPSLLFSFLFPTHTHFVTKKLTIMSDLPIEKTQQEPTLMQNSPISLKQQQQQSIFIPLSSSSSIMVDRDHHHTHNNNNSVKRRSLPSYSSVERLSKKNSFNQEDLSLARNGFSSGALPISVCGNFLCHCISDPYTFHEQPSTGLPPLPSENLRRCKFDVIPSKAKTVTRCLNSEENIPDDSMVRGGSIVELAFLYKKNLFMIWNHGFSLFSCIFSSGV